MAVIKDSQAIAITINTIESVIAFRSSAGSRQATQSLIATSAMPRTTTLRRVITKKGYANHEAW